MRLKSELWVKAYIRQCAAVGSWAVVARRGDPDAGTVFVRVDLLDGRVRLYGPALGNAFNEDGDRQWNEVSADGPMTADEARTYLERRISYDPDIWIVDLESRDGVSLLDPVVSV